MLLRWLVVVFFCLHCVNAAENETFYDHLVKENVSQEMIKFWVTVSEFEGLFGKRVELGFNPPYERFQPVPYFLASQFFVQMKDWKEVDLSLTESNKLKIFNWTLVQEAAKDTSIYGITHLAKCVTDDRKCGEFLYYARQKYNVFNETDKFVKYVGKTFPGVGLDLTKFINEGKKQYNLLKTDAARKVVLEIMPHIINKDMNFFGFQKILKPLTLVELNDVFYNMLWFTRPLAEVLFLNMIKK